MVIVLLGFLRTCVHGCVLGLDLEERKGYLWSARM